MNILVWHDHGSWTTGFVQGEHRYLLPVLPGRPPAGRGRAATWDWPEAAVEVTPEELVDADVDVVVVQRPEEEVLATAWLGGRVPGSDVPLVYLEHNTPPGPLQGNRHPMADRDDVVIAHVTHTNALLWDSGRTPTRVIPHGVVDPGHRFTGEVARAAAVINEPARRGRAVGVDLLPALASAGPLDLYGMGASHVRCTPGLHTHDDLPQPELHAALADHRVYVHPYRWTSLGLSLIEAMLLGLPVVALAMCEVPATVPANAGVVTNDIERATGAIRSFLLEPELAAATGARGRAEALERHGLRRFLDDWDSLLKEVTS